MDKIILICATSQSGSTTLQRIINTIPNSNICGENNGALNNLLEFYKNIKYSTINFIPGHLIPVCYEKIIAILCHHFHFWQFRKFALIKLQTQLNY